MRELLVDWLPWLVLSPLTLWMTLAAGNKRRDAWAIGVANQGAWLVWIVAAQAWGLVPMNLVLTGLYLRNHVQWRKGEG